MRLAALSWNIMLSQDINLQPFSSSPMLKTFTIANFQSFPD